VLELLIRGVIIALRPLTGAWHALQDRFRGAGTSGWLTTTGTVFVCQISEGEHLWRALITYAYSAQGEYWSGEMRRHFAVERDADSYATAHPENSPIVV
jgi:hypothetical protein